MGTRGRISSAELSIVGSDPVTVTDRPQPPSHMSPERAKEWAEIIGLLPADFIPRERLGLFEAYCSHIVEMRSIEKLLQEKKRSGELDLKEYQALRKLHDMEARGASSLSVRLGLAYSTAYEKRKQPEALDVEW